MFGLVSRAEFEERLDDEHRNIRRIVLDAIGEMVKELEPGKNYILILPTIDDEDAQAMVEQLSGEYDLASDDIRFAVIFADDAKLLELT